MRIVIFCHSLASDWNHGNAHFIRGVVSELLHRGHEVRVFESRNAWSAANLEREHGAGALDDYRHAYPGLHSLRYAEAELDLDEALDGASLVLVHEWNEPELVGAVGEHRLRGGGYGLFFHDTHHRAVTHPGEMARYDLSGYDGVLVFGEVLRDIYVRRDWADRAYTWHEAADTRVFFPRPRDERAGDMVWIGNWGDEERTAELHEFLIQPVESLGLAANVYGVRYPAHAVDRLEMAGLRYRGWIPNHRAPEIYARHDATIHVPRRPYVKALPGIPTIRVFEALACGVPLVSAPWDDVEGLFTPGRDYLVARNGGEMREQLRALLHDPDLRAQLVEHGRRTIEKHHSCAHRVDELLAIHHSLRRRTTAGALAP